MSNRPNIAFLGIVALLLASTLVACDESVQPVIQTDRPFTIYGYFNPEADTQAIRVYTIDGVLERTSPEPIDAVGSITNVSTGATYPLADSIVEFGSGMYGHVFWSPFAAAHEDLYRVEVTRSDGAGVSAEARVPPVATVEILPTNLADFELPIPVLYRDAPNLIDITAIYHTDAGFEIVHYGVEQAEVEDGRLVLLQFRRDTRRILFEALANGITEVNFARLEIRAVVTNPEWTPPGGFFDPNVLVEPGTFSNVENGFGFVGAGYPIELAFKPDDAILSAAGFNIN